MKGKLKKLKDSSTGQYVYPITISDAVYVDPSTSLKEKLMQMNLSMGNTGSYVIDTERWGITDSGIDVTNASVAKANSIGLNAAIAWASEQGCSEVILPRGVYLIDEFTPIVPRSHLTINLGGAALRIRDNEQPAYSLIKFASDEQYVRITNGQIIGDRYTHTYSSVSTHEGGHGIIVGSNTRSILLDNLQIFNCTGDSIAVATNPNFQSGFNMKAWEQGSVDTTNGSLKPDNTKIRLTNPITMNNASMVKYGYFSVCGNGWGDFGSQIRTKVFDIVFYDRSNKFISSLTTVQFFDDIPIPSGAAYARMVLYQKNIPDPGISDSSVLSIGIPLHPRNVVIEKCSLHHSRRCGISGGGKYIYIRNNEIHDISGTPPGAAIDVEDGYGLNQFFYLENNNFSNCKIGLSFVSTNNVVVSGNVMDRLGPSSVWDECTNVIIDSNQIFRSDFTLDGEALFTNNTLYDSTVSSRKTAQCLISNNYFHNASLSLTKEQPYKVTVDHCHFYMDEDASGIKGLSFAVFYGKEPQSITKCTFEGNSLEATLLGLTDAYDWKVADCTFINTKDFRLPAGIISGCYFSNSGQLSFLQNSKYEFIDCVFKNWDAGGVLFFTPAEQNMELLRIASCRFVGNNSSVMFLRNITGKLELINNLFEYKNATSTFNIIDFWTGSFTCTYLIVDGNEFEANRLLTAVNLNRQITTNRIFFRNNRLDTVVQPITSDIVFTSNNYINGVLEPYTNVTNLPATGKYPLGHVLNNANPVPGGYQGWVCTVSGYACSFNRGSKGFFNQGDRVVVNSHVYEAIFPGTPTNNQPAFTGASGEIVLEINPTPAPWAPNKSYSVGEMVIPSSPNGCYYTCSKAGISSAVEPKWNLNIGQTTTDGTVIWTASRLLMWKEIGRQAVFKPYGQISI